MECSCQKTLNPCCPDIDFGLLEPYLSQFSGTDAKRNLIAILQKAQDIYGYLPMEIITHIARRCGIKTSKVVGVVSFFTQFRTKPIGKNHILLCQGTACHVNGSLAIEEAIKDTLGVGEGDISPDGLFTYTNVACIGCCSLAPVFMVEGKTYGRLNKDKAVKILKDIASGEEEAPE